MTRAMLDVPLCLDVDAFFVGAPAPAASASPGWRAAWGDWPTDGGTGALRQRAAEECLDTAAVLRTYREPLAVETWLIPADSERRLLAQVNAIIGLGPHALGRVVALALDADLPDPGRVFASLFVLGCVAGDRWLGPMGDIFTAAVARNPQEAAAAVEAASLAPQAGIEEIMRPLLAHADPALRASAVRVLSFRESLGVPAWLQALRDADPRIVLAALRVPLRGYDADECDAALVPVLESGSEAVVRAALLAGAGLRLRATRERALAIAQHDPAWADAAQAVALHGSLFDAPRLRAMLQGPHRAHAVLAVGTLGAAVLVPDLLALLTDPALPPPEAALVQRVIATITGGPADDAKVLRREWAERAEYYDPACRYRHGCVLEPARLVEWLQAPEGGLRPQRQQLYVELCGQTAGRVPRFSAYDFVGVQSASLQRIARWVAQKAAPRQSAAPVLQ
jgi:hypothetical protein